MIPLGTDTRFQEKALLELVPSSGPNEGSRSLAEGAVGQHDG
jgi:hypothetical protein